MTRPLAAAAGAVAAAWVIGPGPPAPAVWLALAGLALAGMAWLIVRRTDALLVAALAALAIAVRLMVVPGPAPAPVDLPTSRGPWRAAVESLSAPRDGQQPATIRLDGLEIRVAATLPRFPAIEPGQVVEVTGSLELPPAGGYGDYLRRIGVAATLRARSLAIVAAGGGPAVLERLRREAAAALARAVPEPEAGLAAGILVGLRDRVDRNLATDFTTAGASHVVAVSGWNIAIVAASIAALAGRLARRRRSLLTVGAIFAYVLFVGASASVLRAAAMAAVVLLARESGRAGRAAAALGWAATLLLVADPGLVRDAGFQLSTVATGGLIGWATPVSARIGRLAGGRLPGWLVEGLGVSLAAQAATLPIVLASFGRLSLVAPLCNLAVVPLVAPAMAAAAVALVAGAAALVLAVPDAVVTILGLPAWALLALIVGIVRFFAGLPFAAVTLDPPADGAAALIAGLILACLGTRRGRSMLGRLIVGRGRRPPAASATTKRSLNPAIGRRLTAASAVALVMAVGVTGLVVIHRPSGTTRIVVLDVGQGDAILVEGSRGGRLLIDGGPDPDRLLVALDERLPPWDRRLDALVLSHPHEDHVAGFALLLERYRIGRVLEPGMRGPGPGYAAWLAGIAASGTPVARLATGSRLMVDDTRLSVLWPDPGTVPVEPPDTGTGINNVSIVLLGESTGRRFLLAGDIEEEIDPTLVARGLPPVDVLKVAHHGSGTASTATFLDAVEPAVAVVSAGAENRYGHPNPGTLERLAARGARVLRTDTDGTVEITIEPGRIRVRTAGARRSQPGFTPRGAATASATGSRARLSCSIAPAATVDRRPPAATDKAQPPPPAAVSRTALYHRSDDGPRAHGRRQPPPGPRSPALVPPAFAGRRGDRGMARRPDRRPGHPARSPARGGGRAAPRRRQAAARLRPRAPPAPRRRLGRLAEPAGPSRARPGGRGPPGEPARRRPEVQPLGRVREPRGADRGLRRQAREPATRADERPLRLVGAAVPGRPRRLDGRDPGRHPAPGRPAGGRRVPRGRHPTRRGEAPPVDRRGAAACAAGRVTVNASVLGYFHGDDGYGLDRSADALLERLRAGGGEVERWRIAGEATNAGRIAERVGTASLFGGGTLAIVVDPGPLVRSQGDRDGLIGLIPLVAPGNGLVFLEPNDGSNRRPAALVALEKAVREAGGEVREVRAPKEGQLASWIEQRARERKISLAPGAAKELATRIGGFVREGDVDRRHQGALAVAELDKLSLHRPDGVVSVDDVRLLVAEAVPGSTWALLDAIAARRVPRALELLERLLETTPDLVVLAQVYPRIRQLIEVADHLDAGATPGSLVRTLGLKPFRADKLMEQARAWTLAELEAALEGLVELDATVRGAPGHPQGDANRRMAWTMWVGDRVGRRDTLARS